MMLVLSPALTLAEKHTPDSPDISFLEFIGEWETEQGEWIDPVILEDASFDEIENNIEVVNDED